MISSASTYCSISPNGAADERSAPEGQFGLQPFIRLIAEVALRVTITLKANNYYHG